MPITISTLPGSIYRELKNACAELNLFQWHVIQIAILSMCYLRKHHPDILNAIAADIRKKFPKVARVPYEDDGDKLDGA
jgi:hypothetical protein